MRYADEFDRQGQPEQLHRSKKNESGRFASNCSTHSMRMMNSFSSYRHRCRRSSLALTAVEKVPVKAGMGPFLSPYGHVICQCCQLRSQQPCVLDSACFQERTEQQGDLLQHPASFHDYVSKKIHIQCSIYLASHSRHRDNLI